MSDGTRDPAGGTRDSVDRPSDPAARPRDADAPVDYSRLESGKDCNYWAFDRTLRSAARRTYPEEQYDRVAEGLDELGAVTGTRLVENSELVEANPPKLHTYDRTGELANEVEYHPALLDTERVTYCEFGLSHDVFHGDVAGGGTVASTHPNLLHALVRSAVLSYADPGFVCPASMTVGAALVLHRFAGDGEGRGPSSREGHSPSSNRAEPGDNRTQSGEDDRLEPFFDRLTTTDHDRYVEGAMFLTEKQGGSDVGAVETRAVETDAEGVYELSGEKWFCSNVDAEGTLVLARRDGAPEGTKGLSLFLVPHTKRDGTLNDQTYRRLKEKLGTLSVPTGEVELRGAEGYLVGEPERGFRYMTEMLNFERLANAAASVGVVGRVLLESKVQAATREAFGGTIDRYPLMRRDLVEMATAYEAMTAFTLTAARLLEEYHSEWTDAEERGEVDRDAAEVARDTDVFRLMRLLVPVAKYRTAREAVDRASYACEVLGGNGYVSGFTTERMLRDAQVLPIWEGTSNVLSLDVLRVLERQRAHEAFVPAVEERLAAADRPALAETVETVRSEFEALRGALATLAAEDADYAQLQAKELAEYVYDVFSAAELLARASDDLDGGSAGEADGRLALVAREWVAMRFGRREARGIADGDRRAVESFDAIVRYAPVDPADLGERPSE